MVCFFFFAVSAISKQGEEDNIPAVMLKMNALKIIRLFEVLVHSHFPWIAKKSSPLDVLFVCYCEVFSCLPYQKMSFHRRDFARADRELPCLRQLVPTGESMCPGTGGINEVIQQTLMSYYCTLALH